MKKLNDLGIELVKKNYRSDFLHDMLEEELAGLIAGKKFLNRSLNFIINYIYRNDNDVEFGLFIINKSMEEVFIRELPFIIKDKNNREVIKKFTYEINEKIKINKAIFCEIKVEGICEKELELLIGESREMLLDNYFLVNAKNLDNIKKYSVVRELKKFARNLPMMKADELSIDLYSIGQDNDKIVLILYFRNSSNRDVSIKSLPLNIYSESRLLAYRDVYLLEDNSLVVPKETGIFFRISINKDDFPLEGEAINKCTVDFIR